MKLTGAGRTDTGVHATGQVVSLTTGSPFPLERLLRAANATLPPDCSIREAAIVEPGFSARFSALERTYVYAILARPSRSALLTRWAWHVAQPLDVATMLATAQHALGEHDFRSFSREAPSTVRCVSRFAVEGRGELIRIEIAANAFLHRMVRSLVGTLVECGKGRRDADEMPAMLLAADRAAAGPVAPPQGLYLAGVRYPDGYDSFGEPPVFGGALAQLDGRQAFP